jgi:NADH:ubiquinone oxidoreductase subunit K
MFNFDMPTESLFLVVFFGFFISFIGALFNTHNFVIILISLDMMLLSCAFGFIIAAFLLRDSAGYFYALFLLVVAASETAIGLGLLILFFQVTGQSSLQEVNLVRG